MARRGFGIALLMCLVLGAWLVPARGEEEKHKRTAQGKVVRVEDLNLVMTASEWGPEKGRELLVPTEAGTKIMADGKVVALGDLKAGMVVVVTQLDGITVEVLCRTVKVK